MAELPLADGSAEPCTGQFARLGVKKPDPGNPKNPSGEKIAWRAYSIVSADNDEHLEFYSIVVPGGEFTSERSRLKVGDTVYVEKMNYGFLTTDRFEHGADLAIGSRYVPGGQTVNWPSSRRWPCMFVFVVPGDAEGLE